VTEIKGMLPEVSPGIRPEKQRYKIVFKRNRTYMVLKDLNL